MLVHEVVLEAGLVGGSFGFSRASFGNHMICFYFIVLGVFKEIVLVKDRSQKPSKLFLSVLIEIEVSDHSILGKH